MTTKIPPTNGALFENAKPTKTEPVTSHPMTDAAARVALEAEISKARAAQPIIDPAPPEPPPAPTPVPTPTPAAPTPAPDVKPEPELPKGYKPPQEPLPEPRRPQLDAEGVVPFDPQDTQQMFRFANFLAKSELVPKALRNRPYDVLLVLLKGRDLGIKPMQSIGCIDIIEGKCQLSAQLIVALIRRSGLCEYWKLIECTEQACTYETLRKGDPQPTRMTFTIQMAERRGLTRKDNWQKQPDTMLRRRCQTMIGSEVYPEITLGLYDEDELTEMRDVLDSDSGWRDTAMHNGVIDLVTGDTLPPAVHKLALPPGRKRDPLADRLAERRAEREEIAVPANATKPATPEDDLPWMDPAEPTTTKESTK